MKLAEYLKQQETRPVDFAARLGVQSSTIARWLKGERRPSLDFILRLEKETNGQVTANDFAFTEPTPAEPAPSQEAAA